MPSVATLEMLESRLADVREAGSGAVLRLTGPGARALASQFARRNGCLETLGWEQLPDASPEIVWLDDVPGVLAADRLSVYLHCLGRPWFVLLTGPAALLGGISSSPFWCGAAVGCEIRPTRALHPEIPVDPARCAELLRDLPLGVDTARGRLGYLLHREQHPLEVAILGWREAKRLLELGWFRQSADLLGELARVPGVDLRPLWWVYRGALGRTRGRRLDEFVGESVVEWRKRFARRDLVDLYGRALAGDEVAAAALRAAPNPLAFFFAALAARVRSEPWADLRIVVEAGLAAGGVQTLLRSASEFGWVPPVFAESSPAQLHQVYDALRRDDLPAAATALALVSVEAVTADGLLRPLRVARAVLLGRRGDIHGALRWSRLAIGPHTDLQGFNIAFFYKDLESVLPNTPCGVAQRLAERLLPPSRWEGISFADGSVALGDYDLDVPVARGAMGVVWSAHHVTLGRQVAVKVLPHSRDSTRARELHEAELRTLMRLDHPGIVQLLDWGVVSELAARRSGKRLVAGSVYVVMEWVAGGTLREISGRLGWSEIVDISRVLLDALAYAHARNVLHRDLKPANVLTTPEGLVRLADFGIAALPQSRVAGTPTYMAPEQFAGAGLGPWTDVYAVGCLVHTLIAGSAPFMGTIEGLSVAHREQPPPSLIVYGVTPEAERWVHGLMAKDPSDRPSVRAAQEALATLPASTFAARVETSVEPTFVWQTMMGQTGTQEVGIQALTGELPIQWRFEPTSPRPRLPTERMIDAGDPARHGNGEVIDQLWSALREVCATRTTRRVHLVGVEGSGRRMLVDRLAFCARRWMPSLPHTIDQAPKGFPAIVEVRSGEPPDGLGPALLVYTRPPLQDAVPALTVARLSCVHIVRTLQERVPLADALAWDLAGHASCMGIPGLAIAQLQSLYDARLLVPVGEQLELADHAEQEVSRVRREVWSAYLERNPELGVSLAERAWRHQRGRPPDTLDPEIPAVVAEILADPVVGLDPEDRVDRAVLLATQRRWREAHGALMGVLQDLSWTTYFMRSDVHRAAHQTFQALLVPSDHPDRAWMALAEDAMGDRLSSKRPWLESILSQLSWSKLARGLAAHRLWSSANAERHETLAHQVAQANSPRLDLRHRRLEARGKGPEALREFCADPAVAGTTAWLWATLRSEPDAEIRRALVQQALSRRFHRQERALLLADLGDALLDLGMPAGASYDQAVRHFRGPARCWAALGGARAWLIEGQPARARVAMEVAIASRATAPAERRGAFDWCLALAWVDDPDECWTEWIEGLDVPVSAELSAVVPGAVARCRNAGLHRRAALLEMRWSG